MVRWLRVKDSLLSTSAISRFRLYYNSSDSLYYIEARLNNGDNVVLTTFQRQESAVDFLNRLYRRMEGDEEVLII